MDGADPLYTLCLAFLLAGVVLGFLLRPLMDVRAAKRERAWDDDPGDDLEDLLGERAATIIAAADRSRPADLYRIPIFTSNIIEPGSPPLLLNAEQFEALAGVSPKRLRELLIAQ